MERNCPTLDQIKNVIYGHIEAYAVDPFLGMDALNGVNHRTVEDIGLDSLDLVEMTMAIEDEFDVVIDDYKLGELHINTPVDKLPRIIYDSIV